MNRIERKLWEESNIKDIAKPKSRGSKWAKAVGIALLVGACVVLASRPWPASFADARVQVSDGKWATAQAASDSNPANSAKAPGSGLARNGVVPRRVVRH